MMERELILSYFKGLPAMERDKLLEEIQTANKLPKKAEGLSRRAILDNRQGCCVHCGHKKYSKFGKDKGAQRYKCASCKRSFTEYSGTWLAGIHHKDKTSAYMNLMLEETSLDKIKVLLSINKKTAFDWRHKILSSVELTDQGKFIGITESDETFFLHSEKGRKMITNRKPRSRGGSAKRKGINDEHIAVVVTQDRNKEIDLTVATKGRLKKIDIDQAIGQMITDQTVLCSDSHISYKGFAIGKKIEHLLANFSFQLLPHQNDRLARADAYSLFVCQLAPIAKQGHLP